LIRSVLPRESSDTHSFTRAQIEALEALALARLGRLQEARKVIRRFVEDSLVAPKSYLGAGLAASAALAVGDSREEQVVVRCANALRVVGATGEAGSLAEIADQFVELAIASQGESRSSDHSEELRPLWRPTNIVCHLDASSPVNSTSQSGDSTLEAFLESVADSAMDPLALGEEALRCLMPVWCASEITLSKSWFLSASL
jgi:hypothetical protein